MQKKACSPLVICASVATLFEVAPYPAQAAKGFSEWQVVRAASTQGTGTDPRRVFANCPAGKMVLGGGAVVGYQQGNSFPADPNGTIFESEPTGGYNGWQASAVDRTSGDDWAVIAYAVCAKVE